MNYSSLEDVYGTPFGQRVPVTHARKDAKEEAIAKPEFSSLSDRADASKDKHKDLIASVTGSLPLDRSPATENFRVKPTPSPMTKHEAVRQAIRETFTQPQSSNAYANTTLDDDKLSRILRLVEQNKTGYERPAVQDMVLYIFTGVVFLFTFDTFVTLGKSMRGRR
jgi:hypothetical protein